MRRKNCTLPNCQGGCRGCTTERKAAAWRNQSAIRQVAASKGITDEIEALADEIVCQTLALAGMHESLERGGYDTVSSASAQCYIETGAYLRKSANELVEWL